MNDTHASGGFPPHHPFGPVPRGFKTVMREYERAIARPSMKERSYELFSTAWKVKRMADELAVHPVAVLELIGIARALRNSSGPGSASGEWDLLKSLTLVAMDCRDYIDPDDDWEPLAGFDRIGEVPSEKQPSFEVLRLLCDYAYECLAHARPRDYAAGQRRCHAFEILSYAVWIVDLPEAVELAEAALDRGRGPAVYGAQEFLDAYERREGATGDFFEL